MTTDPMEIIIETALNDAGIRFFRRDRLDFELLDFGLFIEVKQFHSERIAAQMALAPNVIVAQGRVAVEALAKMLRGLSA